jgi:hypothetical protein
MTDIVSPLDETRSVTIAANGTGTLTMVPGNAHESWHITNSSVTTSTAVKIPVAGIWVGAISGPPKTGTQTGNSDDSDTVMDVQRGGFLSVQWTGADVGAMASVNVSGTRTIRR